MCELKIVFKGSTVMDDVVRITSDKNSVKLSTILGETKTIQGRIVDVDLIKHEAVIDQ